MSILCDLFFSSEQRARRTMQQRTRKYLVIVDRLFFFSIRLQYKNRISSRLLILHSFLKYLLKIPIQNILLYLLQIGMYIHPYILRVVCLENKSNSAVLLHEIFFHLTWESGLTDELEAEFLRVRRGTMYIKMFLCGIQNRHQKNNQ